MLRRSAFAARWIDFGSLFKTFDVLWTQHLWWRVSGQTSSTAFQKPRAPSPTAISGGTGEAARLEIDEQLAPALRALPRPDLEADKLLLPFGRGPDQNQHALGGGLHARLEVDAVGPDVDVAPGGEIAAPPALEVLLPAGRQPRDGPGPGDRFGASGPSSAARASWKSPVETPRR